MHLDRAFLIVYHNANPLQMGHFQKGKKKLDQIFDDLVDVSSNITKQGLCICRNSAIFLGKHGLRFGGFFCDCPAKLQQAVRCGASALTLLKSGP
jgi:hypothetical protein